MHLTHVDETKAITPKDVMYAHASPTAWSRSALTVALDAAKREVLKPQANYAPPMGNLGGSPSLLNPK